MAYETILVEHGRVARLTLNRPEKRNALSRAMLEELERALGELERDPAVVAVLLSGRGRGFCAGADLGDVMEPRSVLDSRAAKEGVMRVLDAMGGMETVIIAQVHGFALAGGFGLAAAADLTVIADDCRLAMPEIRRGLAPMNIMKPLSRCMPRKKLLELMLTGQAISPAQALEWGIANRVVPAQALEAEALALAQSVCAHSGAAVRLCKSAFTHMQNMDSATAYRYLTDMLTLNGMTQDAGEGVRAFLEKREPHWTDR